MNAKDVLLAVAPLSVGLLPARPNLTLFEDGRLMLAVPYRKGQETWFDTFLVDEGDTVDDVVAYVREHFAKKAAAETPPVGEIQ